MENRIKITYIISNIDQALEFQWVAERIDRSAFELSFIFLNQNPSKLHQQFLEAGIPSFELMYATKRSFPRLIATTRKILRQIRPDIVHCHLLEGSLIGMLAARSLQIKNRIYTRHHSTFHFDYAPNVVKYDKLINKLAKKIVSISPVVTDVLVKREKVSKEKIVLIEHGVDPSYFSKSAEKEIVEMKKKYNLTGHFPIIGMISRFDKWKGVNYALEAFSMLLKTHPGAKLVIANAIGGDDKENLEAIIGSLPPNSCHLIEFEAKIGVLYDCFDVFVHVPIDKYAEAFGQIYVEAFFKEVPVVATKSGIGNKLINQNTAIEADYMNAESVLSGIEHVLSMKTEEKQQMTSYAKTLVEKHFVFERKLHQLEGLYRNLSRG